MHRISEAIHMRQCRTKTFVLPIKKYKTLCIVKRFFQIENRGNEMKKFYGQLVFGGAVFIVLVFIKCVQVQAEIKYSVVIPKFATTGDSVEAAINIQENTGLTTLGLRLYYDKDVLEYVGGKWASELENGSGTAQLAFISDISYPEGRALNLSMIDEQGYKKDGKLVKLSFIAKKSYRSLPVTLQFRDATDLSEKIIYDYSVFSNGLQTDGSNSAQKDGQDTDGQDKDGLESDNQGTGGRDSDNGSEGITRTSNFTDIIGVGSNGDTESFDQAFRTGVKEHIVLLTLVMAVLMVVAGVCMAGSYRMKKNAERELRTFIRFKKN